MDTFVRTFVIPFFGWIDGAIYSIVSWTYNLLMKIASVNLFSPGAYEKFNDRIYTLLGIFMLFKISFSLIKYIINPDEFNDKVKGGKRLILNVLIVLVLIVATPSIFDAARVLQQEILRENVVGRLILGMSDELTDEDVDNAGRDVSFMVFSAFYRPTPSACDNIYSVMDTHYRKNEPATLQEDATYKACVDALSGNSSDGGDDDDTMASGVSGEAILQAYGEAIQTKNVSVLIDKEVSGERLYQVRLPDKSYAMTYYGFVSTIAGIVVAWIFFMFCFDIAIRMVKFAFLQLIAPIPIVSYIDPDSSKNGMFNRWVKECVKTYLDLFIRLAAVFFAIYLIGEIRSSTDLKSFSIFEKVIVTMGVLLFAKQVPKLVQDLFGFKSDLKFSFSLTDRVRQTPVLGAAAVGTAGALGGAYAGFKAGREVGQNGIFSGLVGATAGGRQMASKVGLGGAQAGSKPIGAFGNSMNTIFKQMTNREMTNLNPVNMLAAHSVKDRLKEVKTARNIASDQLSAAQVTQEAAYSQMQASAASLNKLNEVDRQKFLSDTSSYVNAAKTYNDAKESANSRAEAKKTMDSISNKINSTYTGQYADVAQHFNDRAAAIEANARVASISKDIDDLSKEKSQIERFGHIDSASTRDVNSLIGRYSGDDSEEVSSSGLGEFSTGIARHSDQSKYVVKNEAYTQRQEEQRRQEDFNQRKQALEEKGVIFSSKDANK